jgi:endonuclease I
MSTFNNILRRIAPAIAFLILPGAALATPPAGYYATVDTSSAPQLRATLHEVIDDHTRFPYTSSSTDTWNILELADQDPANSANILDVYRNRSYVKIGGGTGPYNREHSWPNSYGFPDDGTTNYPYTDCHQLFLSDVGYNSDRANKPFGTCSPGGTERVTDINDGHGGPGHSNWFNATYWQTWSGQMGDVARAMFYLDVRYAGGTHNVTHAAEPDLILTDNPTLIVTTGGNASVAYMGLLSVLLQWHAADPVDDHERARNDVVAGFQGNRNPFIDHPQWVSAIFLPSTGPTLVAVQDVPDDQGGALQVQWQRNSLDVPGAVIPIAEYVIQRLGDDWIDIATEPATQSAAYARTIATDDTASPVTPEPWSQYRVVAVEQGGAAHASGVVSAYSVDNLPPPAPVVTVDDSGYPLVIAWSAPQVPDFAEACVFRGEAAGFEPVEPLQCGDQTEYLEYDTALHYYVVQFADTHGNLSAFSAEVSAGTTDVPQAGGLLTAITRVYPNPFNPRTRIVCSLAEAGEVRVDLFAADGRHVRTLLEEARGAGPFELAWDGTDARGGGAASGSYFLRLQSGRVVDLEKVLLVK